MKTVSERIDELEEKCASYSKSWKKCACGKRVYFTAITYDISKLSKKDKKLLLDEIRSFIKPLDDWIKLMDEAKEKAKEMKNGKSESES